MSSDDISKLEGKRKINQKMYGVGVGVAVGAEPEAQELLVDILRLLPFSMPLLVALRQPIPLPNPPLQASKMTAKS